MLKHYLHHLSWKRSLQVGHLSIFSEHLPHALHRFNLGSIGTLHFCAAFCKFFCEAFCEYFCAAFCECASKHTHTQPFVNSFTSKFFLKKSFCLNIVKIAQNKMGKQKTDRGTCSRKQFALNVKTVAMVDGNGNWGKLIQINMS
jgi:hypothetical protein